MRSGLHDVSEHHADFPYFPRVENIILPIPLLISPHIVWRFCLKILHFFNIFFPSTNLVLLNYVLEVEFLHREHKSNPLNNCSHCSPPFFARNSTRGSLDPNNDIFLFDIVRNFAGYCACRVRHRSAFLMG